MIDARGVGFKPGGDDAHGNGDTDAPLANQLERAGERTPRPDTWFSLGRGLRGYASTRSASRPPTARRGRQTTMHDRNDSTSTSKELSETRVMSPHVKPREKRGDAKNHQTAQRKSFFVNPSTPIYILSRSGEERETKRNCPVKEGMQIGVDGLTHAPIRPPRRSIICVNPLFSRVDMGRHNSGDLIG
jgi:hypothetical protein